MAVKYVNDFVFPASGGFHVQRYAKGGHVMKMPTKAAASAKGMPARAKPNAPAKGAAKMESRPKMGKGQGYAEGGRVPGYDMDRLPAKKPPGRGKDLAASKPERGKYEGYADGGPAVSPMSVRGPDTVTSAPIKPMTKGQVAVQNAMERLKMQAAQRKAEGEQNRQRVLQERQAITQQREADRAARMASRAPAARMAPAAPAVPPMAGGMPTRATYAKGGMSKVGKVMSEYKEGKLHSGSKKGPMVKSREQAVAIALSEARKAGAKIPKKAEGGAVDSYGGKKEPYRGSPKKAHELGRQDRRAREAMERAEKYAPGLSIDMPDRKARGGMSKYGRGGKC